MTRLIDFFMKHVSTAPNGKVLQVLAEPHPFLRQKAAPVADAQISQLKGLIADMVATMRHERGIGLAANQVGVNARLIVIDTKDGPAGFINPEIIERSRELEAGEEGCLSVPGIFGQVRRSKEVTLLALDPDGIKQTVRARGLFARVIQHEIDHLNGILFIDRLENFTRETLPETSASM
jgi:peptide deformylase